MLAGPAVFLRRASLASAVVANPAFHFRPGATPGAELARAETMRRDGRQDEADQLCRQVIGRDPGCGAAWLQLASAALARGRLDTSAGLLEQGLAHGQDANLLQALGLIRLRQRREREALPLLQRAAVQQPGDCTIRANLGLALHRAGRLHEAIGCYRAALQIAPHLVNTRSNLASALKDSGDMPGAIAAYEDAIARAPADLWLVSNLLWTQSHRENVDAASLYALHREWGRRFDAIPQAGLPRPQAPRSGRLKVGFVSADLRDHAVAFFLKPLWEAIDRSRLAIHAYACSESADGMTADLRRLCDGWVDAFAMSDDELAARIRADGIDVLFDLSGHSGGHRLAVFARRAAPVQATWIGYPCTTGLAAMDYLLTDPILSPRGDIDAWFPEKVVRLPGAATFQPPPGLPPVSPLPALERGYVTFGSFHRPAKLGDSTLRAWASLLRRLPTARLLLGHCDAPATREALATRFARDGVDPARLSFQPRMPLAQYLALHQQIDLSLDTFSFSGGTTTLHSLFMGVPVITAMGHAMPARQTGTILIHAGLEAFVATSPDSFGDVAARWAGRLEELAGLRLQLREHLLARPLLRDSQVPRAFGVAVEAMWDRWAQGMPPAAMDVSDAGTLVVHEGIA